MREREKFYFEAPCRFAVVRAEKAIETERRSKQESQRASERARTGESWWCGYGGPTRGAQQLR